MRKIAIAVTLSKVFDSCQQWSQNRAFLKDNPNKSRDILNFTYAMSEDDKIFFEEYSELVCSEVATDELFAYLRKFNKRIGLQNFDFDYANDFAKFFFYVSNDFIAKSFQILLFQYIKYQILRYWYWEKNLYDEVQIIDTELARLKDKIENAIINEAKGGDDKDIDESGITRMRRIPYNNGFIINPHTKPIDLPTEEDEIEVFGLSPKTPETEIQIPEQWYFAEDLPETITMSNNQFGGNVITLRVTFNRKVINSYTDFSSIKVVLYKDNEPVKTNMVYTIPATIMTDVTFIKGQEYHYEVIMVKKDNTEKKLLESTHCILQVKDDGVYSVEYKEQYS